MEKLIIAPRRQSKRTRENLKVKVKEDVSPTMLEFMKASVWERLKGENVACFMKALPHKPNTQRK